jgi:hypothetical protein
MVNMVCVKTIHEKDRPDPDPGPVPLDPNPFPTPKPPNHPARPRNPQLCSALFAATFFSLFVSLFDGWSSGLAQTTPATLPAQSPQNPAVISPITPSAPRSGIATGLSAMIITPTTTNRLAPNPEPRRGGSDLSSARRGMPGMSGGFPLNSPLGARDPAPGFMRPRTIGPLFCDPIDDISC